MLLTLVLIRKADQVLLGMKKRGFGAGRWNGFGGKLQSGESVEQAARREVREEVGLEVGKLEKFAVVTFVFPQGKERHEVHMFRAGTFLGEPQETEEMKPGWFGIGDLPFSQMWPDDKYWFPLYLEGKKFTGVVTFGEGDSVVDYRLNEVIVLD